MAKHKEDSNDEMFASLDLSNYKKLSSIEHCLARPSIYIGSMEFKGEREIERYNPSLDRPIYRDYDATFCDGLNTMFNELVNNSYDEYVRQKRRNAVIMDRISAIVNPETGKVAVWDNGGIPVVKHPEYDEWLPQMLFGNLRSGSNYVEDRGAVAGVNGVGASLVNVFSKQFTVITAFNGLKFTCTWHDNMSRHDEPFIEKCSKKEHFTYIEAYIDLARWQIGDEALTAIPNDTVDKWLSRCIEIAVMGCNEKKPLTVEWHNEASAQNYEFAFQHFWQYKDMWQGSEEYRGDENDNYSFEIGPSRHGVFESFALVNSIRCDYGTHMDFIANVVADYINEHLQSKHGIDITDKRGWKQQIFKQMSIMSMWHIPNASFDAQIKDKLATPTSKFGFNINISDKLKKYLASTAIVQNIVDEYRAKQEYEAHKARKRKQKEMDDKLTVKTKQFHVDKLVDASQKYSREECELFIIEGDSASQGIRSNRDAKTQGFYCLKGKSLGNTFYLNDEAIMKKEILTGLMMAIGLKFNQKATTKNLRFGRISILTDADVDGDSICAMLLLFFAKFWPELFDMGIIQHVVSPLIVATKGEEKLFFYTQEEFKQHEQTLVDAGYELDYKKGLAALTDEEFEDMMRNPIYEKFNMSDLAWQAFDAWFGSNSDLRKDLMGINRNVYWSGN